ncbi:ABC transporter substrate-binding protein [Streptosporangium sp. NPDC051022]|uniref:ABC transporter substrate-binding protein n=1 Tax=Streptosporangium sp. NPDC051022 TaxID=3155752 RepID=UPI003413E7D3
MCRLFCALTVVLLAISACASQKSVTSGNVLGAACANHAQVINSSTIPPETTEITVGSMPIPDTAALEIAMDCGFFASEGLKVRKEIIQGTGAAIPDLKAGHLQFCLLSHVTALAAQSSGVVDLRYVADAYQAAPETFLLMVPKDSTVRGPADLRGRSVAVTTLKSVGTLTTEVALKAGGLTAADVKMIEMPLPNMPAALQAGTVSAAWLTEPFITAAKRQGARAIADVMTGPTDRFPVAGYGTTAMFAERNPEIVAAFQRAITAGQQIAASGREVITKILPVYTRISPQDAERVTLGGYPVTLDPARLERVAALLREYGYTDRPVDIGPMLRLLPAGTPKATPAGHRAGVTPTGR